LYTSRVAFRQMVAWHQSHCLQLLVLTIVFKTQSTNYLINNNNKRQWPLPANLKNGFHIVRIDPIIEHPKHNHHMVVSVTDKVISNGPNCGMGGDTIFGLFVLLCCGIVFVV
jgi:hypothetical protein